MKSIKPAKLYRQTAQKVDEYNDKKTDVYYSGSWSTIFWLHFS